MSTPSLDDAIEALRKLPPERQQELAAYIFQLAIDEDGSEQVDPADLPSVQAGVDQARRKQFASPERVAEVLGLTVK